MRLSDQTSGVAYGATPCISRDEALLPYSWIRPSRVSTWNQPGMLPIEACAVIRATASSSVRYVEPVAP